jgi:hypothetical protein
MILSGIRFVLNLMKVNQLVKSLDTVKYTQHFDLGNLIESKESRIKRDKQTNRQRWLTKDYNFRYEKTY